MQRGAAVGVECVGVGALVEKVIDFLVVAGCRDDVKRRRIGQAVGLLQIGLAQSVLGD